MVKGISAHLKCQVSTPGTTAEHCETYHVVEHGAQRTRVEQAPRNGALQGLLWPDTLG